MFVKAIKIAKKAIFPIFRWEQISNSQANVRVSGTGFFVNSKGYFVSTAHLFDNTTERTSFLYIGRLPDEVQKPRLIIQEIARNDEFDIFIGKIEIKTPKYFYLAKKIPDVGKAVCISGYPLAIINTNPQGGLALGGVRRYFQPSFVLDLGRARIDNGTGIVRIHDGFMVRDFGLFGMSGGPIFDINGMVIGMQASITPPRESRSLDGRTIIVENAQAIRSNLILDTLRNNRIRSNFWGKF